MTAKRLDTRTTLKLRLPNSGTGQRGPSFRFRAAPADQPFSSASRVSVRPTAGRWGKVALSSRWPNTSTGRRGQSSRPPIRAGAIPRPHCFRSHASPRRSVRRSAPITLLPAVQLRSSKPGTAPPGPSPHCPLEETASLALTATARLPASLWAVDNQHHSSSNTPVAYGSQPAVLHHLPVPRATRSGTCLALRIGPVSLRPQRLPLARQTRPTLRRPPFHPPVLRAPRSPLLPRGQRTRSTKSCRRPSHAPKASVAPESRAAWTRMIRPPLGSSTHPPRERTATRSPRQVQMALAIRHPSRTRSPTRPAHPNTATGWLVLMVGSLPSGVRCSMARRVISSWNDRL